MMTATPRGAVDWLHLKQISAGADIAEGGDVVAKRGLLSRHLEVLHQCEMILGEVRDRPASAADEHENVGGMRVAIGGGAC